MIISAYPFFRKRYAYDLSTNVIHDLKCETSLLLDHPVYTKCPHCMKK